MLKLFGFLKHNCKLYNIIVLGLVLSGCGDGSVESIVCGGEPCPTGDTPGGKPLEPGGPPSSIQYVSAVPAFLSIRSAGGDETSVVTFLVTDVTGNPSRDVSVSFKLSTIKGGVVLNHASARTNAKGEVWTVVQAGTAKASVSVTATVDATQEFTISPPLSISTGIPDYNSFSLSLDLFNPNALDRDGEVVNVTARTADIFNNPPPDGAVISFYTEGGKIESQCTSNAGACSVEWTGQNPRPIEGSRDRVGRVAILAYTDGAESFNDINVNGVFDDGDKFLAKHDQAEPWADHNENGLYDVGEFYVDTNHNGVRDLSDGLYNGPLCTHSTLCSPSKTITISRQGFIVMSSSVIEIVSAELAADLADNGILDIGAGKVYPVSVGDVSGNSLPGGSSISITTTNGTLLSGNKNDILKNTLEPKEFAIHLKQDAKPSSDGAMIISVSVKNSGGTIITSYKYPVSDQ